MASVRRHIKELSAKEYHLAARSGLDYVVMFVPIEGALAAAVQADSDLAAYAVSNNVALATPTTIMIALRTVANVWQVERRNRNAELIAERAGFIYDKLVGFLEDMTNIESRLTQARAAFDAAMGKLSHGRGNLIRQAEQLKELGARTNKTLPNGLLEDKSTWLPGDQELSIGVMSIDTPVLEEQQVA